MTATVLRMADDKHQHWRYHLVRAWMMRSSAHPQGVPGYASTGVTLAHYIRPAAEQAAKQRRVESLLAVG
jgi:hypothetical protein